MPRGGSKPGERRGGRQKGTPNKVTLIAKDAITFAAEKIGGAKRLAEWIKEDPQNERTFWSSIFPKLMPTQITGEGGGPLQVADVSDDARAKALAAFIAKTRATHK